LHTGERPYPCGYCPMTFQEPSLKRYHVLTKHPQQAAGEGLHLKQALGLPLPHPAYLEQIKTQHATYYPDPAAIANGQS